jgi:hypothetical protein
MVRAYLPYMDVGVSQQTQQARIVFAENSALASVLPYDFIEQIIDLHLQMIPALRGSSEASHTGLAP